MNEEIKIFFDLREKTIKNSMLLALLQGLMLGHEIITIASSIQTIRKETKEAFYLKCSYINYEVVVKFYNRNIYLGLKYKDSEPIWEESFKFPNDELSISYLKNLITHISNKYTINACKVNSIFNCNKTFSAYLIESGESPNFWKLGFKKAHECPEKYGFSKSTIRKYLKALRITLKEYQAFTKILIDLVQDPAKCHYEPAFVGYVEVTFAPQFSDTVYVSVSNCVDNKFSRCFVQIKELSPKNWSPLRYDNIPYSFMIDTISRVI